MPRPKASTAAESVDSEGRNEPEQPVESDERVDLDEDNDPEETMEEEVEYEEVEVEEEEEEEEEEIEEEVEEEIEEDRDVENADGELDEDEKRTCAKLLARPPHGSEVYMGGIPHDVSQEDLKCFCESVGEVTEGKKVRCSTSQSKHRLFIGNIPRSWGEEDLRKVVSKVGPGVTGLELVKDVKNSSNNRGFAFVEYYNNACAEYSRQKMIPEFRLGDNAPTVSWADPKNAASSAASQVKAIYVKNLPKDVTQDQLKKLFEHHGKVTKVVLPPAKPGQERNRIGFVHFAERSCAMKALKNTERYELSGQVVECSLAKPQADQKTSGGSSSQNSGFLPSYPPQVGYGLIGGAYGALGPGYGVAGLPQPLIYGRGATPTGMSMMPMLLPDGRIGYVLQQPGAQQPQSPPVHQRHGRGGSSSSRGRHGGSDSGRRYRPY